MTFPPEDSGLTETPAVSSRPGIFYENLASAQAVYDQEHQAPKEPRFSQAEWRMLIGSGLLLLLFLGLMSFFGLRYDPDAPAMRGEDGISMDNRDFAIYYQNAYAQYLSEHSDSQGNVSVSFDRSRSLKKQYYDLETGYSWEDYFIDQALPTAALTESLLAQAQAEGFSPDAASLASLEAALDSLPVIAAASGYLGSDGSGDVTAYVQARFGPDVTEEAYRQYLRDTYLAQAYSDHLYASYDGSLSEDARTQMLGQALRQLLEESGCKRTPFAATGG
jgi:hypothetical protein